MSLDARKPKVGEIVLSALGTPLRVCEVIENTNGSLGYIVRCNNVEDEKFFDIENNVTFYKDPSKLYYPDSVNKTTKSELSPPTKLKALNEEPFNLNRRNYININFNF